MRAPRRIYSLIVSPSGVNLKLRHCHPERLRHNSNMRWILCLITALGLAATAEMNLTVAKLVQFIHSAIDLKQPDRQVAEYLKHVRMVEKLDDKTIEDLQ